MESKIPSRDELTIYEGLDELNKMNLDKDFDETPLYSKILDELYQGGTEEEATIYRGNKRLPTIGDPRPFDSVVS